LARSLDDIALMRSVLIGVASELSEAPPLVAVPRIGLCRTYLWNEAAAETRNAVEVAGERLAAGGALIEDFALPDDFAGLSETSEIISNVERSRAMAHEWHHHRKRLSPQLVARISAGLDTPNSRYVEALRFAEHCRIQLDMMLAGFDALLAPAASGEAPRGLDSTGDSAFQALWTLLHGPTVSLPAATGPNGLPVGIQVIAPRYRDEALLRTAWWAWDVLSRREPAQALVA
jgi:amidase